MGMWDKTKTLFGFGGDEPSVKSFAFGTHEDPAWTHKAHIGQAAQQSQLFSGGAAPRRGTLELLRAYRNVPMLFSVVSKIADNAASTPLRMFISTKKDSGGKRLKDVSLMRKKRSHFRKELHMRLSTDQLEEIDDHRFLSMLDIPNDAMDGRTLMFLTHAWLDVVGEAFWIVERDLLGLPVKFWPVPSHWVTQFPTESNPEYLVAMGTSMLHVAESDMLWFHHPDLESPYSRGTAGGQAVADDVDVDEYTVRHINSFFHNRALPDMIVSVAEADDGQLKIARQQWERENLGFSRAYKTAWISGEVSVQRLDTAFNDLGLVELRRYTRDVIYQTFGISPEMLGVLDDSNRATISEARYLFSENVLVPRLDLVVAELQRKIIPDFDDRMILSYDDPVPDDNEFRLRVMKEFPHAVTLNEIRALGSLPEREDMDKVAVFDEPTIVDTIDDYENPEVEDDNEEEAGVGSEFERQPGPKDPDREVGDVQSVH